MSYLENIREKWVLLSVPLLSLIITIGSILRPGVVYEGFVWKYFWGPIVADSLNSSTAVLNGVVAHRGYNVVNEIGYAILLGYFIFLLVKVLRRFDVGEERNFIRYFVPFIVGGGLLRVVEDAVVAEGLRISLPPLLRFALISPLIYFTMFLVVFLSLLAGIYLQRRELVGYYGRVVAGTGAIFSLVVFAYLLGKLAVQELWMGIAAPGMALLVLGISYGIFRHLSSSYPGIENITSKEGLVVLYGHLLDGSATSLSIEILGYGEKHPLVDFFINTSGSAYTFVPLKLVMISLIMYYMGEDVRSDGPLFYNLVLLGILAVGLGPGVRNMTRAFFGV